MIKLIDILKEITVRQPGKVTTDEVIKMWWKLCRELPDDDSRHEKWTAAFDEWEPIYIKNETDGTLSSSEVIKNMDYKDLYKSYIILRKHLEINNINEITVLDPNRKLKNIKSELEAAGFNFDDGILGGVGSGGGGYYDYISDKISGYHLDTFNQDEFDNWYDNFSKNNIRSNTYESTNEDYGIDYQMINQIGRGMYAVGESGYDEGYAEIHKNGDGDVTLYSVPTLSNDDGNEFLPIFLLDRGGRTIPKMSKKEVEDRLRQNIATPRAWALI